MTVFPGLLLRARVATVLLAALALAACAGNPERGTGGAAVTAGPALGLGTGTPQEFATTVGDRVFFETDSVTLTDIARATLDRQAQWLLLYPRYRITIEGHADERGTREYNIGLGARRADAARGYLISRGIAPERIAVISYGKERPVAICNDISCWSQNRRAVTVVNNVGV